MEPYTARVDERRDGDCCTCSSGGNGGNRFGNFSAVTGSVTVGAIAGSAFTALVSRANISLINNQGNVKAALKELGSKENVRASAFAMATVGVSVKLDKTLAKYPIKTRQNQSLVIRSSRALVRA